LGLCGNCQAVVFPHTGLNQPPPGGLEPQKTQCPVCGKDEREQCDFVRSAKKGAIAKNYIQVQCDFIYKFHTVWHENLS
ncbi:MAG: hypothetical protein ACYTX0_62310, partial [Nostoc sp.]